MTLHMANGWAPAAKDVVHLYSMFDEQVTLNIKYYKISNMWFSPRSLVMCGSVDTTGEP